MIQFGDVMSTQISEILSNIPLFVNADRELLEKMLSDGTKIANFAGGERILPEIDKKRHLAVIIKGKAQIFSNDSDRNVILRSIGKGDLFGIVGLFDENLPEISRVYAKSACTVIYIPPEALMRLIESDRKMMYSYIAFLEKRIRFLSKKIICYTAGSAERRLAYYLDSLADENVMRGTSEPQTIMLGVPISTVALTLGIGRASLYRAIDTLTLDGFIRKEGKKILLLNRTEMLKYYTK